ncbi:outer-membrane lipoprotein carrier protein LolA [Acetobacter estunensis]|uniref:LolA family protein n=1 Tax=Acetobacter estunensis TaxID=104097 RepID=UPI001C2D7EFF|nr:outer-membrane lipoprotein carrier protein LolA [Acetobacter estunensis]MBV1838184.1 outer membrane lipoprotein carrier protein LolA [Acetobacter estunensis]
MFLRSFVVMSGLFLTGVTMSVAGHAETVLTPADQGWVARVQDAMNGVTTLEGRFQQVAPDGQRTTGRVWLARPGRMRFEYDKPSPLLLVANDGKVVFRDSELDQTTEMPLERTPLGLLLAEHLSLSGDVTVTDFRHEDGILRVAVVRTASPGEGTLEMIFSAQPVALRGWIVTDAQGHHTQVMLSDLKGGRPLSPDLFVLPHGG